jgi:hypothetical protein
MNRRLAFKLLLAGWFIFVVAWYLRVELGRLLPLLLPG